MLLWNCSMYDNYVFKYGIREWSEPLMSEFNILQTPATAGTIMRIVTVNNSDI